MSNSNSQAPRSDLPHTIEVVEGKSYLWCACGLSKNQPLCDFSHRGTQMKPIAYSPPETLTVVFCGCKRTKVGPFCDGSHAS